MSDTGSGLSVRSHQTGPLSEVQNRAHVGVSDSSWHTWGGGRRDRGGG